ncbi:pre-mRNA processing RNA-helicase, partial [Ascosphaera pollenicola]
MGNPRIAQQALLRRQQIEEEMLTQKMPPRYDQPINNEIQGKAIQSEMAGAARGPPVAVVHPAVANVAAGGQPPQNPVAAMQQNANIAASMAQAANQPHPPPGAPIPAGIQQAPAAVQAPMPPQGHVPAHIQAAVPIAPVAGGHPQIAAHPAHPAQPMAQTGAPVAMMPTATVPPAAPGAAAP